MYHGSTILLCVTIFVIHKQCLIRAHCSIVTVVQPVYCICRQGYIVRFPQCSVFMIPGLIIGIRTLWLVSYSRYLWLSNIRQFCLHFFTSHICPKLGMTRYSDFFGMVQRTKWNISVFRPRLITNFKLCLVTLCTRDVGKHAFISGYHLFWRFWMVLGNKQIWLKVF
jgi:hypothetical protein